jgi:hypothetical protein
MITYPTLIGISGPAGSGKNFLGDCIAQVLQDNNFSQTHVGGFADELKREVLDALVKGEAPPEFWMDKSFFRELERLAQSIPFYEGLSVIDAHALIKRKPDWVRALLQWWGTDYRRKQNPNYWVDQVDRYRRQYLLNPDRSAHMIITDVRFPNEASYCLSHGMLLLIDNPQTPPVRTHESESHFDTIRKMGEGGANFGIIHNNPLLHRPEDLVSQFFTVLGRFNRVCDESNLLSQP